MRYATVHTVEKDKLMARAASEVEDDQLTADPEAQACQKAAILHFDAYRIGSGRRQKHWAHRWHVDRWFRSWQCEWEVIYGIVTDQCASCPRAWTKRGAIRKAKRWYRRGADIGQARRRRPWKDAKCGRFIEGIGGVRLVCQLPRGHEGDEHTAIGGARFSLR